MIYKHGIYGEIEASNEEIAKSKSIPVYIGTAPMYRLPKENRDINKPILIKNYQDAVRKTGYRTGDDFEKFSLSAAIYAHFENSIQPIGPIVVINVLNPEKGANKSNQEVSIINGKGILNKNVIIDSVEITDKILNEDYELEYTDEGNLLILAIKDDFGETVNVKFSESAYEITDTDIIGNYIESQGISTGIKAIDNVYEELNVVPTIVTAPGWNENPKVRQALLAATKKISDKWEAVSFIDIDPKIDTIENAIKWKKDNGYNSNEEKLFWPKGIMGNREIYLSILGIVTKMQTDAKYNNIPYQTLSNKAVDISSLTVKGHKIKFSQNRANDLNASGITTAILSGGKYVLWGPHMANYEYGVTIKPEEIFDVNIMMQKYLLNDFQLRNPGLIDNAMSRHDVDAIVNNEQMILDSYTTSGVLLYGEIKFKPANNSKSDIINGDFTFNTLVTNTPIGKSITQKLQYSSVGIQKAFLSEGGEN